MKETVGGLFPNVDEWGAAEWFERLVMAVERRDMALLEDDAIAYTTYKRIAAASATRLVRGFKKDVRAALTAHKEGE